MTDQEANSQHYPNRNSAYAHVFVDELVRSGLQDVVLVPGSRHTPLVLAFTNHPGLRTHSHLDERSAAFYALGLALSTERPVAIACTSGSAGANMYPAIVEAHQSRVPLIVITADRPPELRHSGANQTMDQTKMFGDFVLWAVDAALPESSPPAVAMRNLQTTANRAYATANGIRSGVVHVNMPFRKPLEPTPTPGDVIPDIHPRDRAYTMLHIHNSILPPPDVIAKLNATISEHQNGIIIAGGQTADFAGAIAELSVSVGYPVLAEARSGLRGKLGSMSAYEFYAERLPRPDVILRFGDVPISKALNSFIANSQPKHFIHISADGVWADDSHTLTDFIHASPPALIAQLDDFERDETAYYKQVAVLEQTTWQVIRAKMADNGYFDAAVVYDAVSLLPEDSVLVAGNSLPIRHVDQFANPQASVRIFANRGVSGIDGNISTTLGIGAGRPGNPLVAILGDITFYHDMNGLLAVHRCGVPVTIVLLNNDGGGIFHRLPIRDYDPTFTDYFVTPHGLDFEHAAALYGLAFQRLDGHTADAREQFQRVFRECVGSGQSTIIEVCTDARHDLQGLQAMQAAVNAALDNQ